MITLLSLALLFAPLAPLQAVAQEVVLGDNLLTDSEISGALGSSPTVPKAEFS
ncbi:MAG: hypothetical protein V3S30_08495 [Thermoanaerobaculia bacterium]